MLSLQSSPSNAGVCFSLSTVEACRIFQQPLKPLGALVTLQKVKLLVLRLLVIFAGGLLT